MSKLSDVLETKGRIVHTTPPDAMVVDAAEKMCRYRIGALLVGDLPKPVGIFSERDLMSRVILERRDSLTTRVDEVMTKDLLCVDPDTSVAETMAIMTERRCRHIPVVTDGRVVGLVSIGDLVRWASREQEFEIRWLNDYLCGRYPG